eukprot:TRINITY_DN46133_c0_g1_i1.p1 TRINITY_DN46133_c0_g1~~TRINITY_DN46133_c0_g1_i1.p1  ORF type:complete len:201 (+),score=39.57 TRINITY_DN46133_c0_g1_i1:54-605(+)
MAKTMCLSRDSLEPQEESWREALESLSARFPTVDRTRVLQVLRDNNGHGGYAAASLRSLTSDGVREADADDIDHVATLLSSPAMFKHACKDQFRKFDKNRDGALDWDEVLALTAHLYERFGLEPPSEGTLQAFFDSTDENHDGVLSEREFRKFFESFLRHAYFDVHKLREIVDQGRTERSGGA